MMLLNIWVVINLVGFFLIIAVAHCEGRWSPLIYPVIDDYFENNFVGFGKWVDIFKILVSVIFAPALIVYFALLSVYVLTLVAVYAMVEKK